MNHEVHGIRIRCLITDSENHIWACTNGEGLWEIDGDKIIKYNMENGLAGERLRVVVQLKDGRIAAACEGGVNYIKEGKVERAILCGEDLGNARILSLQELSDGALLAGT